MIKDAWSLHRLLLLTVCFCSTSLLLAQPDECSTAGVLSAVEEYKFSRSHESFVHLQAIRDSAEISSDYASCRTRKYFWVRMVEVNLLLSKHTSLSVTEKLFYLSCAESGEHKALEIAEASIDEDRRLNELMADVYSSMASLYFEEQDSLHFHSAIHKRDSVYAIITPRSSVVEISGRAEPIIYPVVLASRKSQEVTLNSDRADQQTVVVQVYLYNENSHALESDSFPNTVVAATDISSRLVVHAIKNAAGDYELKLTSFHIYSINVTRSGYARQTRTVRSDGSGQMMQRYYLFRPGVPFYYTNYDMQVPYDRNDKYIGIKKNDKCVDGSFEQLITDLGLVKCAGDSVQLYRKANGLTFNATNDSVLSELRTANDKVDWAGPVIGPIRGYPIVLTGRIKIYFLPEENLLPEENKAELDSILVTRGFKTEGIRCHIGPQGVGAALNSIAHQINQLPYVWFAIAEYVQQDH